MIKFYPLTQEEWPVAQDKIGIRWCEDTKGIVGIDATGKVVAVCVLDTWSVSAVQAHIWLGNPFAIKAGFLTEIANYVYGVGGREVMLGIVPGDNPKAIDFDRKIGFTEVCRIRDGHAIGVDTVILEMRKEDCKWFTGNDSQQKMRA